MPGERCDKLRADRLKLLDPLRSKAWRWSQDNLDALKAADPETPEALNDRAADNWRPLLAIADRIGGDLPERARQAAIALSGDTGTESGSLREQLLADVRHVFESRAADRIFSAALVEALNALEDRPWPEIHHGKPLTAPHLSKLLKPFGIGPRSVRIGEENAKGYHLADFTDTFTRYLRGSGAVTTSQANNDGPKPLFPNRHTAEVVTVPKVQQTLDSIQPLRCDGSQPLVPVHTPDPDEINRQMDLAAATEEDTRL